MSFDACDKLSDPDYEPRVERPPCPPELVHVVDPSHALELVKQWDDTFLTEIKLCGEKLQRHSCRKVCFKSFHGSPHEKCRFKFPRDEVDASYYDESNQSVIFSCHDGTVNNYNPFILVFSRHNHDLKCILSGQAAKSAMMYITDYITKMDMKTYEVLSLLSEAVLQARGQESDDIWQ